MIHHTFLRMYCITDSILNHSGTYYYAQGKILIHLRSAFESDANCTTPGSYLRYHRKFQNLTTQELAERIHIVPATVILYENDQHDIPYKTAVAISEELGIDRRRLMNPYTAFVDYPCAELLKKIRSELGMSQMQFSAELGVAQSAYSRWERGATNPRRQEYNKIIAVLEENKLDIQSYITANAAEVPA